MDYHAFIPSRVREYYDCGIQSTAAVGSQRGGRDGARVRRLLLHAILDMKEGIGRAAAILIDGMIVP